MTKHDVFNVQSRSFSLQRQHLFPWQIMKNWLHRPRRDRGKYPCGYGPVFWNIPVKWRMQSEVETYTHSALSSFFNFSGFKRHLPVHDACKISRVTHGDCVFSFVRGLSRAMKMTFASQRRLHGDQTARSNSLDTSEHMVHSEVSVICWRVHRVVCFVLS